MKAVPFVSVVICVRDGATTLRAQLDALARQVDAPPFDVVVVDNGSSDGTAAVARGWINAGVGAARDAYIVDAADRPGIPFARNVGAASSSGSVLAFCDADDVVGERWVQGASAAGVGLWGAVTGPIRELRSDGTPGALLLAGVDSVRREAGANQSVPFFWGCNFAMSRDAYEAIGGFDAGLPPYGGDDSEAGIRLARAGITIGFDERMVVAYRQAKGWRTRLRRRRRGGIGLAVQWARHPDFYPRRPSVSVLACSVVIRPVRVLVARGGRLRTRALRAAEEGARMWGALEGTLLMRRGHYVDPEYYDSVAHRRPH